MTRVETAMKSSAVPALGKTGVREKRKKYDRSQYVIENTERHVRNELKRTRNEPQLNAQMREIDATLALFDIAHVGAGDRSTGGSGRDQDSPTGANPEGCERIQKRPEQSQNVDENKAHHFLNAANQAPSAR